MSESSLFHCGACGRRFVVHWPVKRVRAGCPECKTICKSNGAKITIMLKAPRSQKKFKRPDPVAVAVFNRAKRK